MILSTLYIPDDWETFIFFGNSKNYFIFGNILYIKFIEYYTL